MNRTSGLSMPMPNAIVATMISPSARRNRAWFAARVRESSPAWYGSASSPLRTRNSAVASTDARVRQYTIPASPACSVRISSSSCRLGSFFGTMRYWMLGRSKLATNWRAPVRLSRPAISARVAWVAVAVSAMRGTQGQVVGPEVMAPLGHAVRLVDGEQADRAAVEQAQRGLGAQPFRRQVEQVELVGQEFGLDQAALVGILRGVEEP